MDLRILCPGFGLHRQFGETNISLLDRVGITHIGDLYYIGMNRIEQMSPDILKSRWMALSLIRGRFLTFQPLPNCPYTLNDRPRPWGGHFSNTH
jgi:hypothetical protein